MTDWVAVSVDIHDDVKILAFAKDLGVTYEFAALRLIQVWGRLARHENEEGFVGDVDDPMLESWAGWRGKAGRFAKLFRERFTKDGRVNGWWNWNGRMLQRLKQERLRKRLERSVPGSGGESADNSAGRDRGRNSGNTGTSTRRYNSSISRALERFEPGLGRDAVERVLESLDDPRGFIAEILGRIDREPGHKPATAAEIGQAIHDMRAAVPPEPIRRKNLDIWIEGVRTGSNPRVRSARPGSADREAKSIEAALNFRPPEAPDADT